MTRPVRGERMTDVAEYSSMELMICCASRELEDGRTAAVRPSSSSREAQQIISSIAL